MFKDNLISLRKMRQMTQEDIAEKLGVSRQSVAKWESGETVPDLEKCRLLADAFGVSLDDLANHQTGDDMGFGVPPKGKHLFGVVTVGDKGNKKAFIKEKTKTFFLLYQKSSEKGSKKPLHICNALF